MIHIICAIAATAAAFDTGTLGKCESGLFDCYMFSINGLKFCKTSSFNLGPGEGTFSFHFVFSHIRQYCNPALECDLFCPSLALPNSADRDFDFRSERSASTNS